MQPDETLHIFRSRRSGHSENFFGLVVTPFIHRPGPFPTALFDNEQSLSGFLSERLRLPPTLVQEILADLRNHDEVLKHHLSISEELLESVGLRLKEPEHV